jgi:hypothetical protein
MLIQTVEFDVVGVPARNGRMPSTNDTTKKPKKPSSVCHIRCSDRIFSSTLTFNAYSLSGQSPRGNNSFG